MQQYRPPKLLARFNQVLDECIGKLLRDQFKDAQVNDQRKRQGWSDSHETLQAKAEKVEVLPVQTSQKIEVESKSNSRFDVFHH
jgi:hypothetical protein